MPKSLKAGSGLLESIHHINKKKKKNQSSLPKYISETQKTSFRNNIPRRIHTHACANTHLSIYWSLVPESSLKAAFINQLHIFFSHYGPKHKVKRHYRY